MMNQKKIQELVSRSQQDDKRAFALLVSEFQPLVFRLAFRLLCDEYKRQNKLFPFLKTFCARFCFINTKQNVHFALSDNMFF